MGSESEQRKTARELLKALDNTIEKGPWDKSIFLGTIGKKLKEIRFNFKNRLRFLDPSFEEVDAEEIPKIAAPIVETAIPSLLPGADQIEAFVSLYNVDGGNLQKWEKLLQTLDKQIVTRPVYGSEQEIRGVLRAKTVRKNDAYAAFFVNKSDIIQPRDGKSPTDRLGNVLLILKDAALKLENITRFCHESGIYTFRSNTLSRVGDMSFMNN